MTDTSKSMPIKDGMNIKDLPKEFILKIKESLTWADIQGALRVLNGQDEHNAIVIASTEEDPAPHKDVAVVLTKDGVVDILVACKVFDADKDEYLEETKILSVKTTIDELDEFIADGLKTE